jgi:hypothetical protein
MILFCNMNISLRLVRGILFSAATGILWASNTLALAQAPAAPQPGPPPTRSQFHEPAAMDFNDHTGYMQIFDGKSLADWEGDPAVWRVENGAIVGESSKDNFVSNAYIWRKDLVAKDFDLKLEIKCEIAGGSGIQYRSQTGLPWNKPLRPGEKRNLDWMMTGPRRISGSRSIRCTLRTRGSFTRRTLRLASLPGAAKWCIPALAARRNSLVPSAIAPSWAAMSR